MKRLIVVEIGVDDDHRCGACKMAYFSHWPDYHYCSVFGGCIGRHPYVRLPECLAAEQRAKVVE